MARATIELDENVATALLAQAEAHQMSLNAFLERIAASSQPASQIAPLTEEEWDCMFDEVSSEFPKSLSTFSRAEIYFDHD